MATLLLRTPLPSPSQWEEMGIERGARDPNVVFLVTDQGNVFTEMDIDSPVRSAHPHQIYLDLLSPPHPDRETAERIRRRFLDFPS